MKNFEKALKKQLEKQTPNVLDRILAQNAEQIGAAAQVPVKQKRSYRAQALVAAALVVCLAVSGLFLLRDNQVVTQPPTITTSQGASGGGAGEGDKWVPINLSAACSLPDGERFSVYAFQESQEHYNDIVQFLQETLGITLGEQMEIDDSLYYETGLTDDVRLYGNFYAGFVRYQNNTVLQDETYTKPIAELAKETREQALALAKKLEPLTGLLELTASGVAELDEKAQKPLAHYEYQFEKATQRTINGAPVIEKFTVSFGCSGEIATLWIETTTLETRPYEMTLAIEDILAQLQQENEGTFLQTEHPADEINAVIKSWHIEYTAGWDFDDIPKAVPMLHFEVEQTIGKETDLTTYTLLLDLDPESIV